MVHECLWEILNYAAQTHLGHTVLNLILCMEKKNNSSFEKCACVFLVKVVNRSICKHYENS